MIFQLFYYYSIILLIQFISILYGLRPNYQSDLMFNLRPPNIIQNNNNNNNGENGYRLLTSKECDTAIQLWKRKIGILNEPNKMELYEMFNLIEDCSKVMPGKFPHRKELLAFGEFQQGNIHCILLGYLTKVKCPWDLEVLAIAQLKPDHYHIELMVEFLNELCIEHACVPDYTSLEKWSIFEGKKWINTSNRLDYENRNNEISILYQQINLSPCIILDDHNIPYMSTYWFKTKLNHNKISYISTFLYWRQKRSSFDEFEIRFAPPIAGVSSGYGTVGCHIIIDTDDNNINMNTYGLNNIVSEYTKNISKQIKAKIIHPINI